MIIPDPIQRRLPMIQVFILVTLALSILWRGGKSLDATLVLAILAGSVTLLSVFVKRKNPDIPTNPIGVSHPFFLTGTAFVFWTLISFCLSATRNYGFDEVIRTASLFLLLCVTADQAGRDRAFSGRFARTVAVTALIACAVGLVVYCLQPVNRAVGTFFDWRFHTDYWPNAWAQFLLLAWPLTLWSLYRNEGIHDASRFRLAVRIGALGILLGLLLLSFSRGAIITFVAQLTCGAMLLLWQQGRSLQWKKFMLSVASIALTGVVVFAATNEIRSQFHPIESVVRKATLSSDEGASSVTERVQFWRQAITLAKERPLFGWGPYSFRFVQPRLQTVVLATSDHAHNVFLKLAAERGFPAAALMLLIIALAMIGGLRGIGDRGSVISSLIPATSDLRPVTGDRLLTICFLLSITGVLLHNLIDYNLQFIGIAMPLWMMFAFLATPSVTRDRKNDFSARVLRIVISLLLLPATVLCTWQLMQFSLARRALTDERHDEALTRFSSVRSPLFPRDDQLTQAGLELHTGRPENAKISIDAYFSVNEEDARAWTMLGAVQQKDGDDNGALWSYRRAFELGRWNDISITRKLVSLLQRDKAGLDLLRPEVETLVKYFTLAIGKNSHFIALGGNVEELVLLLRELATSYPSDADRYLEMAEQVEAKASEVRRYTSARPQGILW